MGSFDAASRFVEYTAPDAVWEVVVSLGDSCILGTLERCLHATSEQDVMSLIQIGVGVVGVVEEHWFVECTAVHVKHAHFSVVVWNQGKLDLHCVSDHVSVVLALHSVVEPLVWLLRHLVEVVVVAREGVECADLVPTGA